MRFIITKIVFISCIFVGVSAILSIQYHTLPVGSDNLNRQNYDYYRRVIAPGYATERTLMPNAYKNCSSLSRYRFPESSARRVAHLVQGGEFTSLLSLTRFHCNAIRWDSGRHLIDTSCTQNSMYISLCIKRQVLMHPMCTEHSPDRLRSSAQSHQIESQIDRIGVRWALDV